MVHRVRLGHVGLDTQRLHPQLLDLGNCRGNTLLHQLGQHHVGARPGQAQAHPQAYPLHPSGHDCDPSV